MLLVSVIRTRVRLRVEEVKVMTAATHPGPPGGEQPAPVTAADLSPGRPFVFRHATVLTMDDAHHVRHNADVLITG